MRDKNYIRLGQIYQFIQNCYSLSKLESLICNDFDINYQLPRDSLVCQNNPQYIGNTALHFFATYKCNVQFIELLIKNGADVTIKNKDGFTPLLLAFKKISIRLSNHLAYFNGKNTINIHLKNGLSHFHVLCTTDNVEVVELFLKSGVDINERVNDDLSEYPGYTPLHFAAHYSRIKIIELLMTYGADLKITDARGMSSMHLIVKNYLEKIEYNGERSLEVKIFLKNIILNNDLYNFPDNLGFCRLHFGSVLVDEEISIDQFFDETIDIDSPINFDSPMWPGCTPLHLVVKSRDLKSVQFLLEKRANIFAKDANGTTVLDLILNSFRLDNIINIFASEKQHKFSELQLTDGTRLLDIMHAMKETKIINKFFKSNIKDVNTFIPLNSPLWPGCNLLHLQAILKNYFVEYEFAKQGVDFTMINAEGTSPLHLAFRKRSCSVMREIYKYIPKKPVNLIDRDNVSHLLIACTESCEEVRLISLKAVKCMLKNGADPNTAILCDFPWSFGLKNCIMKKGSTPLHIALYERNIPLVNTLMSYGANVCLADSTGVTPFQVALIQLIEKSFFPGKTDLRPIINKLIAQMLESHGKDLMTGETGVNSLRIALSIIDINTELLKQIVKEFDREQRYEELDLTRLQVTCATGDFELIKGELESGADVNAQIAFDSSLWPGDTALHILLRKFGQSKDHYIIIKLLLQYGADTSLKNAKNLTPFHLGIEPYQSFTMYYKNQKGLLFECDSFLSKYNFANNNPTNDEGLSHFHLCCMGNNVDLIKEFLKSGVDVNARVDYFAKNFAGYTSFHFLVVQYRGDNENLFKLFLSYGADPNTRNAYGLDACHVALQAYEYIWKAFLRFPNVDIYATSIFGDTALDIALKKYNPSQSVKKMAQYGYELCHKDIKGKTVLHKSTDLDTTKGLLSLGADINIRDDNGKTCVQYANKYFKEKVFAEHIQLLQSAGVYVDNLSKIDFETGVENLNIEVEKQNLEDKLKILINPAFSADYFFSEKFVVDYKTMSVSQREKIYNFCTSNDFCDFEVLTSLIKRQFYKIRARSRLLSPAESAFEALINRRLPDCIEPIFNYLNYDDLMNLVRIKYGKLVFSPLTELLIGKM